MEGDIYLMLPHGGLAGWRIFNTALYHPEPFLAAHSGSDCVLAGLPKSICGCFDLNIPPQNFVLTLSEKGLYSLQHKSNRQASPLML